jgi:hypothetical protein
MREHAIPQDITGYRFHIIGSMTIKQFAEIGAGVILAIMIYATNLPTFVKWPLIAIAVGLGAMAAFVPIEERPFDHWIITFFRVLYKPTKFYWQRHSKIPDAFLYTPETSNEPTYAELDLKPARRQRIKEYLTSVEQPAILNELDLAEQERLRSVMVTFNTDRTQLGAATRKNEKPDLRVRVRALAGAADGDLQLPQPTAIFDTPGVAATQQTPALDSVQRAHLPINQVATKIAIPELNQVDIESEAVSHDDAGFQNVSEQATHERAFIEEASTATPVQPTQTVTTNTNLPFPLPPTEPNKLVGMVLSPNNDLLNDSIVEIQTENGQVARAVKTNALGQFFVTTPLESGTYTILAEKDGFQFAPLQIMLTGAVVPPLEIRSA